MANAAPRAQERVTGGGKHLHHAALIVHSESMDAALQVVDAALNGNNCRVDLGTVERHQIHDAFEAEMNEEHAGLHDAHCPAAHRLTQLLFELDRLHEYGRCVTAQRISDMSRQLSAL